jgi:hypothetical protein
MPAVCRESRARTTAQFDLVPALSKKYARP